MQVGGYVGGSYDAGTGQVGLDAGGQVKALGQEVLGVDGRVYDQPGGGIGADGQFRSNLPDLSQMPDLRLPDQFPNIPLPPMPSLPTTLPELEWRPTNLPGNTYGSGRGWPSS